MVWKGYYLIKKDNYLKISTLLICVFSVFAIILNVEGNSCITQISSSPLINNSSTGVGEGISNSDFMSQQAEENQQQQEQEADTRSQEALMQQSYELRKYCFLVTNLYVYSLFGVVIGFIILVLWYLRYKKNWSGKKNGPTK
ncbi:hypothetical protein BH23THE1_BH23THE1_20000 [soil metagenome]